MKPFTTLAILVFSLVAILQLIRLVMGWEVSIGGVLIPLWASAIALFVAGLLAAMLWRENRARRSGDR